MLLFRTFCSSKNPEITAVIITAEITAQLFGGLRTTAFMIMIVDTKHGKIASAKKNSGWKLKVNDRDLQALRRTVFK